jgi:hypothetical protein
VGVEEIRKIQEVNMFIGQKDFMVYEIRKTVIKTAHFEDLITSICNICVDMLDGNAILHYTEKANLIKV